MLSSEQPSTAKRSKICDSESDSSDCSETVLKTEYEVEEPTDVDDSNCDVAPKELFKVDDHCDGALTLGSESKPSDNDKDQDNSTTSAKVRQTQSYRSKRAM